jgi:flagellar protein FliS
VTNPYESYIENSVLTATPLELVAMLYRCAINSISQARKALAEGDVAGRVQPVNRAYDAVTELSLSLDHNSGGEVARQLSDLYTYISHKIILGHATQSDEAFAEAARLLSTLVESWDELARGAAAPPLQTEWNAGVTVGVY